MQYALNWNRTIADTKDSILGLVLILRCCLSPVIHPSSCLVYWRRRLDIVVSPWLVPVRQASPYTMLLALIRIFFGVDMALGFFNYAAWSWLAERHFNICFLFLSIFSTHFPDVDMIPYLFLRRRYGLVSHWVIGHHPLLVLPLVATASFAAAKIWMPDAVSYSVGLVSTGVLLHFLHDGANNLGFPWLSPFSKTRFRFRSGKFGAVPKTEIDDWMERVTHWKQQAPSATDEIFVQTPPITLAQLLFWGAGLIALGVLVWHSRST